MKIEVKDNNIEQALRVLKRKLQRDGFFKVVKLTGTGTQVHGTHINKVYYTLYQSSSILSLPFLLQQRLPG